ncbi:hypothetical protein ACFE04_016208 [Oxalis oulophora]
MLLRSSSTPLITNLLLSPFSDSPSRDHSDTTTTKHSVHYHHNHHLDSPNSSLLSSSSISGFSKSTFGVRRSRSDSNLQGLSNTNNTEEEEDLFQIKIKSFSHNKRSVMLRSEPSFCVYSDEAEGADVDHIVETQLNRTGSITGDGFSFGMKEKQHQHQHHQHQHQHHMVLIEEEDDNDEDIRIESPLYLATGLGIGGDFIGNGNGNGNGSDLGLVSFDEEGGGGGGGDVEEYYKRKLDQYPFHPLILRNYAQLLKKNGNFYEAEEYFYRATLADPNDGEILALYAKLLWEVHQDEDRALHYFERAVQAAPQDSHVLAAYASFLWEMDGDGEEDDKTAQIKEGVQINDDNNSASVVKIPVGIQIEAATANRREEDVEDHYKRMIEENPGNAMVLRNYAQFLHESKGDLGGAEEFYSRAIIADPLDGEVKSQYARLVWELHRDHDKALSYFEQAAQASPGNSTVLAAYASFLWETEEDDEEEDSARPNPSFMPVHGAMATIKM